MFIDKISFWSWAYSDFLSNTNRSVFWEFIIHEALWLSNDKRIEWDNVDLRYNGKKIEVKTSAYIQSWEQKKNSKIIFDIAPRKRSWDSSANITRDSVWREADVYIFCLLEMRDKSLANSENILDVNNWWFYILQTNILNSLLPTQKSISLWKLEKITKRISFLEIKNHF